MVFNRLLYAILILEDYLLEHHNSLEYCILRIEH